MSPSSGIRAGFPKCVDRAPTVRQFAPGLCGCGFELRRCLHEESEVEGPELLEGDGMLEEVEVAFEPLLDLVS